MRQSQRSLSSRGRRQPTQMLTEDSHSTTHHQHQSPQLYDQHVQPTETVSAVSAVDHRLTTASRKGGTGRRSDGSVGASSSLKQGAMILPVANDGGDTEPLVLDSRTGEIRLSRQQEALVWEARCHQYRASLKRIVVTLESHAAPIEKCHRLIHLHEELVIQNRLRLRSDTYEEIFHVFYVVANSGALGTAGTDSQVTPAEETEADLQRAIHAQTAPFLHPLWTMYRYMIDSGTEPTQRIIQHVMGVLARVQSRNIDIEARAHSLMLDCDRRGFPPSDFTLSSYADVCSVNGMMHLAVARAVDVRTRYETPLSAGVYTKLLTGLLRNGNTSEAQTLVSTMNGTALTPQLLNAALNSARLSKDPTSALTMYRSVQGSGIRPSIHTISILLQVLVEERQAETVERDDSKVEKESTVRQRRREKLRRHLPWILQEMKRYRIRGDAHILNRILSCYVELQERRQFEALCTAMQRRNIRIFTERYPRSWVPSSRDVRASG